MLFLGASCENDAELTTLKTTSFSSDIEASSTTLVLKEEDASQPVELISWPAVKFSVDAPVTYTLEIDVITDISGDKAWGKAKRIEVGEDVLSKTIEGLELNIIATELGLQTDVAGKLVVRLEARLDHKVYSDYITLTVTPYGRNVVFPELYMPGSYQGWNIATAAALSPISRGVYQGYMVVPVGSGLEFKLNTARNWENFYGAGNTNSDLRFKDDKDFLLPAIGSYQMKVDLNTLKWTATPYAWGIVGPAQSGSWDNSTPMTYDHQTKTWKVTANLVPGALKFRLNNSWTVNYGPANPSTNTINLDNPNAYDILESGTYDITFTIDEVDPVKNGYPATATCTIVKK